MYAVEIDFKTEEEHIRLTDGKFATPEEGAAFAISFIEPYIENCVTADGEWKVFDTDYPNMLPVRHSKIRSIRSMRVNGVYGL